MHDIFNSSQQIDGEGIEVGIDESKFGKCKYYRRHRVDGQWVFGGREKYNKSKFLMVPVNKRDAKTLLPNITKWIAKGSIIHSNCWEAYNQLEKMGYQHVTVNHSKQFFNPETAKCTDSIESDLDNFHLRIHLAVFVVHIGSIMSVELLSSFFFIIFSILVLFLNGKTSITIKYHIV